jgi:hypothetical protein
VDLADALKGAVLAEAVRESGGDARKAFAQLGLEARTQGGNHLKTLRRERQRLEALCAAIGVDLPPDWAGGDE